MQTLLLLLAAIALVESGNNDFATGLHGEKGRFQMKKMVWEQHTKLPFSCVTNADTAEKVALRHLVWISENLHKPFTVANLALAWKRGVRAVNEDRCEQGDFGYAARVENLVREKLLAIKTPSSVFTKSL